MLEPILEATRQRIAPLDTAALAATARRGAAILDFDAALRAPGLAVIAEIKRSSPSAGPIAVGIDVAAQAQAYVAGGAAAISVLTEPQFFGGSLDDLEAVRAVVDVPVLRKDFTLHPSQIWEARAAGADAVLLIVAALPEDELARLVATAKEAGLAALIEVHTIAEARIARRVGGSIVGVNNRDLTTFRTDLATAESVAAHIHGQATRVAESGVSSAEGAARMAAAGYDAILVGEALVRSPDPASLVRKLRGVE
jgi:indole-3-glycerol phosphate synthase